MKEKSSKNDYILCWGDKMDGVGVGDFPCTPFYSVLTFEPCWMTYYSKTEYWALEQWLYIWGWARDMECGHWVLIGTVLLTLSPLGCFDIYILIIYWTSNPLNLLYQDSFINNNNSSTLFP